MKKLLYMCMAVAILLPFTAQATLSGDFTGIDGTNGIGISGFEDNDVLTSSGYPHFSGDVTGDLNLEFIVEFYFYDFGGNDYLEMRFGPKFAGSGYIDTLNFSVTFDDLDFGPSLVLTGVAYETDTYTDDVNYEPLIDPAPGLINPTIPSTGHTLTLNFEDFYVNESRVVEFALLTEVETGGGPSTPVPEPATMALLGMGLLGLAARHKINQ